MKRNNPTIKRMLALLLALSMVVTLTACNPPVEVVSEAEPTMTQEEIDALQEEKDRLQAELDEMIAAQEAAELEGGLEALLKTELEAEQNVEDETSEEASSSEVSIPVAPEVSAASADTSGAPTQESSLTATPASNPTAVAAIAFNKSTDLALYVGQTNRRTAATSPAGGAIAYTSSNPTVASVASDGNVTCISIGNTLISATSGGMTASYNLTVVAREAQSSTANVVGEDWWAYLPGGTNSGNASSSPSTSSSAPSTSSSESNSDTVGEDWSVFFNDGNTNSGNSAGTNNDLSSALDTDAAAKEVIRLVNEKRIEVGLHELIVDSSLMSHAAIRAKELETSFSHTRPNGIKETSECAAEGQRTAAAAFQSWMNSDAHRRAILNENGLFNYNYIGAGCHMDASGKKYWIISFSN